jgi:hypothetical protein
MPTAAAMRCQPGKCAAGPDKAHLESRGGSQSAPVCKRDSARLWRYRSEQRRYRPPVLIVHSLVSKSYVLDLLPNTSMVRYLVGEGFDVFLLDWMPPDPADAEKREGITAWAPGALAAIPADGGGVAVDLLEEVDDVRLRRELVAGGSAGCGRANTVTSAWPEWCSAARRWGSGSTPCPSRYARAACTPRSSDARARHRIPPGPDRGDARGRADCTSGARSTSSSGNHDPATPKSFLPCGAMTGRFCLRRAIGLAGPQVFADGAPDDFRNADVLLGGAQQQGSLELGVQAYRLD